MGKVVISMADIEDAVRKGERTLRIRSGECIVTPGARDRAREMGVTLLEEGSEPAAAKEANAAETSTLPETAEALVREVCRNIGKHLPEGVEAGELERLVRGVVAARLAGEPRAQASVSPAARGAFFVRGSRLLEDAAGPVPVEEKAIVAEALGGGEEVRLAGGFMEWENAAFRRVVESAEIAVVLEGELRLAAGETRIEARPGDMLYFAPGTELVYEAQGRVRLACVNGIR